MSTMPIWFEDGQVKLIDQTKLPVELCILEIKTVEQMWHAIKGLLVRGAPAIGLAGAFGVYIGVKNWAVETKNGESFLSEVAKCAEYLDGARPTAVNLHWAVVRMQKRANILYSEFQNKKQDISGLVAGMLNEAQGMLKEDIAACKAIGEHGANMLEQIPGFQAFLTHCNAGALATSQYGTALAPAYVLQERGRAISVYSDETRPLLQGSRLTAWELSQAGIPVTTICDNMAGVVMQKGCVQAVITGADRIAANGDTANKIGTYSLAILAKAHKIPFFIAAPLSTIDPDTQTGEGIPIEERGKEEVRCFGGKMTAPIEASIFNPAFDVTPQEYITGIITEKGILYPPFHKSIQEALAGKLPDHKQSVRHIQSKVAEYGRKLKEAGLVSASFGNISMLDETRRYLAITPSGIFYDELQPEDICVIDRQDSSLIAGNGRKPSSELPMHQAVYENRPDVSAVIHTHSVYATVVASSKTEGAVLPMVITELCMAAPGGIKTAAFALPGSDLLAENAVKALGNNAACLLANHGTLACGDTLQQAFTIAAILEEGAKIYVIGKQSGEVAALSEAHCERIFQQMKQYGKI